MHGLSVLAVSLSVTCNTPCQAFLMSTIDSALLDGHSDMMGKVRENDLIFANFMFQNF